LQYYEYYGASNSDEVFDNLYRGQLLLYVYKFNNGDQKIKSHIEQLRFEQQDLENIVDEINGESLTTIKDSLNQKAPKADYPFICRNWNE